MAELVINGRFLGQRMTGVQRVAHEISQRLKVPHSLIHPGRNASGGRGHGWEQLALPVKARGRVIWSPCNTGPLAAKRQVVTIHDAAVFEHPEWFSPRFGGFYRAILPVLAKRVDRIVTVSDFSRERLSAALGIDEDRIEVVHNGVNARFRPTENPSALPAAIATQPYFVTLSTREPRKNLPLVIEAWKRARPGLPDEMRLVIVGGQGAAQVFGNGQAMADEADSGIIFTGYLAEEKLPAVLSGAHALLYPSLYEGFGLPALEAMACGTPVVTTRLTSLPEVCGDDAFYVDPADADDLAAMLVRLTDDDALRAEHGRRGIARVKRFTWERAAEQMDSILARHL